MLDALYVLGVIALFGVVALIGKAVEKLTVPAREAPREPTREAPREPRETLREAARGGERA